MRIILTCDAGLSDAFDAREPADYLIAIREWASEGIVKIAERAGAIKAVEVPPDEVKEALAEVTEAAIRNDAAGYAAARIKEAEARARKRRREMESELAEVGVGS